MEVWASRVAVAPTSQIVATTRPDMELTEPTDDSKGPEVKT